MTSGRATACCSSVRFSFDAATEELYTCLTVGGTLVLRGGTMLASTATFLEECAP